MYFHTQKQGVFFMNLGRDKIKYPFSSGFGGVQSKRGIGVVKNVFFNFGENETVIEDRMMILLQCKRDRQEIKIISPFKLIVVDIARLITKMYQGKSLFFKGRSDQGKTSITQQDNNTQSSELGIAYEFEYFDKEYSEFLQKVKITLPYWNFENMILHKSFFTRKFGIIGQASWKDFFPIFEDSNIFPDNKAQAQSAMDTQYLFQIPLITMSRDVQEEQSISGQIFAMKGGIRFPNNPQIQNRLSLKANSQKLDSRYLNASINDSYAIYLDDLIFYKGVLSSMIANQRAVFVPKEIKNSNLLDPDFFLTQETDDSLNLIEINLEDNQSTILYGNASTQANKEQNYQEEDWKNISAQRSIRPRPILHYLQPLYQKDPQTREFFTQDSFQSEIIIKTPDVQFLDPFIISVEDKTRILVYSSVDQDRYYIYDLQLHFELFVEVGCQCIIIDEKTYYNHQVSLFLTFDLKSNQHRLECLILPSYEEMSHNRLEKIKPVFIHYRFPYMIVFEKENPLEISMLEDLALNAQFLQIPKKKLQSDGDQKKIYQDVLVLQTQQSILIYDLEISRPCSQRDKYPTQSSQVPIIRANENVMKTIVCGVPSIRPVNDQQAKQKIEEHGYPNIYFAYLNGTNSYPNRPGIYKFEIKSQTFGETQIYSNANDKERDEITSYQRKSSPQLIYEFPPNSQPIVDRILAMSFSEKDTDGVSLLLMDNNFAIKVLKLEIKDREWSLAVVQTSIQPLLEVEKIWNRLTQISHGEGTRPRIILTDQGAYIESNFYAFIPQGSFQVEAKLDFEKKRDTKLSQRLKARDGKYKAIWLNSDGLMSSQGHLLMWYRRVNLISSEIPISHPQLMKSRLPNRKMAVKNDEGSNILQAAPLITQKPKVSEQHFFLVASQMRSRIKRLMSDCNDTFVREQVVFTSFIGNKEDDDILVFLKNGRFLIFDNSGSIVPLNVENDFVKHTRAGYQERPQQTIVDTLNAMKNNENFLKLLILNKDKDDYFTAELKSSFSQPNSIKGYSLLIKQMEGPTKIAGQNQICKFDTQGNVCNFIYPKVAQFNKFKDNDLTMSLNLKLDKDVSEMIMEIVQEDINSQRQISERRSKKSQKNFDLDNSQRKKSEKRSSKSDKIFELDQNEEDLLFIENREVVEPIRLNLSGSDFDFIDLKEQMKMNGMMKQIRYFVFRYKNEVVYKKFVSNMEQQYYSRGLKIDDTVSEQSKLKLNLSKDGIITQFLPVDKKHHIQFMFYDPKCLRFFLFTWDLQANREVKMLKLEKTEDNPYFQLTRGTSLRQNYIIMHGVDKIYDLHLEFSQNFISGKRLWGSHRDFEIDNSDSNLMKMSEEKFKDLLYRQAQSQMHEIKANYDGTSFLGLRKSTQTQLHRGFSLFDLQYIDYIRELYVVLETKSFNNQSDNLAKPLILDYLNVQLPFNANIVHIYHRSYQFLSNLYRELKDQMQQIQRDKQNSHAEEISPFLYYSLIPLTVTQGVKEDEKGKRGLSMALKGSYGECFELMVEMLMLHECGINYMTHIKPYIIKLLSYESDIVRNFLQSKCSRLLYSPKLHDEQRKKCIESYKGINSQYIEFEENKKREQSQAKANSEIILSVPIANQGTYEQVDERESEDEHQEIERQKRNNEEASQHNNAQMKKINLYSYDFDGYLIGERQKLFLSYIIQQDNNLKIFDLNYIKIYLDYQWSKLKWRYFFFLLAQIINNILMIVYVIVQQSLFNCSYEDYDQNFCQNSLKKIYDFLSTSKKNELALLILRSLLFSFSLVLNCIDFIRLKNQKSFLNTFFFWVNIAYLVKLVVDIYLQNYLFLQLYEEQRPNDDKTKYFSEFGANENTEILLENRFLLIPILIIKASNAFFMLTLPMQFLFKIRYLPGMTIYLPKFFDAIKEIKGLILIFIAFTISFVFSYSILSVLDFRMDALDIKKEDFKLKNSERNLSILKYVAWIFGGFIQIMIQLIFVYAVNITMFIGAAMIKADKKATEEFEQLKLLNLARFIAENEVLINRKKLYKNVHYVIHSDVKQEKISSAFNIMNYDEWEQRDKKHGGGRRQNRKCWCSCCASIFQGKPIELVYEAK